MSKKIRVISCILTFAVMALIFFFSSQNSSESSELSFGFTERLVNFFLKIIGMEGTDAIYSGFEFIVRKCAHFTIFAALGAASSFAVMANRTRDPIKIFCTAVVFSMLYAVSDEVHQLFVGGRAARILDVFIDTCGAAAGAGAFAAVRAAYRRWGIVFDGWVTLAVIVMAAIFVFSSQDSDSSNQLSHAVSEEIVNIASPVITPVVGEEHVSAERLNPKLRKAAHFSLYLLLGFILSFMMSKRGEKRAHIAFLAAVIFAAAYAATDEFHQSFVDGRGPLVSDVLIDSCGATAGAMAAQFILMLTGGKDRRRLNYDGRRERGRL